MYTLASYAVLDWSAVIIKYELQDKSQTEKFESFVRLLFPKAAIIRGRSDNQEKFRESLKMIRKIGDDWVFYAGNVDHPFIASETKTLAACLTQAKKLKKKHKFVSIFYSHFGENQSLPNPQSYTYYKVAEIIDENKDCKTMFFTHNSPFFNSIQIMHVDMLAYWIESKDLAGKRLIRGESFSGLVDIPPHAIVVPNREICAHFDGYSHVKFHVPVDPNDVMPPQFIPDGFFEGKIKIAFGYPDYREGWVNVNPTKEKYSFRSTEDGTDLKLVPDALPLFWKGRIAKLDINPKADMGIMRKAYEKHLELMANPWPCHSALERKKMDLWILANALSYFVENPEELATVKDYGWKFNVLRKRALYAAIMAGYKIGLLKKKQKNAHKIDAA